MRTPARRDGRAGGPATAFLVVGFLAVALVVLALLVSPAPLRAGPATGAGTGLHLAAAPQPAGVTIGTVPAVAGFPVTLDGVTRLTDERGAVFFGGTSANRKLRDRLTHTEAVVRIGDRDVKVSAGQLHSLPDGPTLALDLSYLVRFDFSSVSGVPIDASSLTTITVKSTVGEVVDLPAADGGWLPGTRVVNNGSALVPEDLEWSVQQVEYAGSNVVNTAQQRFRPAAQPTVAVQLLFFSMDLQVHDAMFGYRHGGAVELVYPDGSARRFDLDVHGRLHVSSLPRGDYTLTILGSGPRMLRPLAISRDQDLDLAFYSWWDVGTVLGVVGALALALAVAGRRRRRIAARAPEAKHRDHGAPRTARVVDIQRTRVRRTQGLPTEPAVLPGRGAR